MNAKEYLNEVAFTSQKKGTEELFNDALKQVFSPVYLSKIENVIKKNIKLKEKKSKNANEVAWTQGNTIYVNPLAFDQLKPEQQIRYLLHEFLHWLMQKRGFFTKQFKDLDKLSKELYKIMKKYALKDIGEVLTGQTGIGGKYINYQETLAYLMNGKADLKKLSPEGRNEFIAALKKSGIFNLAHPFWKKRLQ